MTKIFRSLTSYTNLPTDLPTTLTLAQVRVVTPWDHVIPWTVTEESESFDVRFFRWSPGVVLWSYKKHLKKGKFGRGGVLVMTSIVVRGCFFPGNVLSNFVCHGDSWFVKCCDWFHVKTKSRWPFDPRSLEVTNNLWKGHVFTIPKKAQELSGFLWCCWLKSYEKFGFSQVPKVESTTWPCGLGGVSKTGVDSSRTRSITFLVLQAFGEGSFFLTELKPSWKRTSWITHILPVSSEGEREREVCINSLLW